MHSDLRDHRYLGDGVYASFDGFHIWLHVGDHRNPPVVAIEQTVYNALAGYAARHWNRDRTGKVEP